MKFRTDYLLHTVVGIAVSWSVGWLCSHLGGQHGQIAGVIAAGLVGYGKEIYDRASRHHSLVRGEKPKHSVDPLDALFTCLGGVLAQAF